MITQLDFDGDCVEVMFISPKQLGIFEKYNSNNLIKGHTDITLKKSTKREKSTGQLAHDQKELKLYVSLSGSIAIELSERARTHGYGHTQVSELYHFMAQLALNLKHRRDGIELIKKLSAHFLGKKVPMSMESFVDIVKQLNPNFKEKDLRRLKGLFKSESTKSLNFTRNNVNQQYIEELAGSVNLLTEKQEKEVASRQFII